MAGIALGVKSGFIGKSQYVGYDLMIGAPERDSDADQEYENRKVEQEASLKGRPIEEAVPSGGTTKKNPNVAPRKPTAFETLEGIYNEQFGEE
jgi:hypothetical protein